jgi:molecular chaperone GrpE
MTESFEEVPQTAEDGFRPLEPATLENAAIESLPSPSAAPEPAAADEVAADELSDPVDSGSEQETPTSPTADPVVELTAAVTKLLNESEKYHARASHRETVIDNLHAELERLRTGERRGTVRPLLVSVARIRDDLMCQAAELPGDFDAIRAQKLLQSFADSIEILLDDYGVSTCTPAVGDEFDARRHKAVSSMPTADAALARTIASVRRDGYQDVEAGVSLKQAEVVVFVEAPVAVPEPPAGNPVPVPAPPVAGIADEAPTAQKPTVASMSDSAEPAPAFSQASTTVANE